MKISTKGRYSMHVMLNLAARSGGEYVSLKEISSDESITVKYLEQIIPLLLKAGLVKSTRGTSGGYKLSKLPSEYTAGEILRAAEGELSPADCAVHSYECAKAAGCAVLPLYQGLYRTINDYLDGVTLESMLTNYRAGAADSYVI